MHRTARAHKAAMFNFSRAAQRTAERQRVNKEKWAGHTQRPIAIAYSRGVGLYHPIKRNSLLQQYKHGRL